MSLKEIKLGTQFRSLSFRTEGAELNEADRILKGVSISSDEPYERWFGTEILSHEKGAIRLDRVKNAAAPLLFNHDRDQLLGKIMNPRVEGGKLRVDFKFSQSERGMAALREVQDGILTECSIGYMIHKFQVDEDTDEYRAIDWEIHEASLVTVPADATVGVGRADERGEQVVACVALDKRNKPEQKTTTTMSEPTAPITEPKIDVVREREDAAKAERKRVKDINDYVSQFKVDHMKADVQTLANKSIEDGTPVADFEKSVIAMWRKGPEMNASRHADIGMSDEDIKEFSILRAIRSMATVGKLEGHEKDFCDQALKNSGRALTGNLAFMLPEDVVRAGRNGQRQLSHRAQVVGTATAGGFTVDTTLGSMVEYLRNRTVLGQVGITTLSGLQNDVALPVQTGGCTAYWVAETASLTDSQATFAQRKLSPKRLGATIPLSTQFIAQSSLSAESFARNELMTVLAIELDRAGLLGSGVSGEPLGVANTTGINATVTYGGSAVWADVVEHETGIAVDNADIGSMGFILSSATVGKWKTILKDSVAGAGYLLSENMTANGYPVYRTNQISAANQSFFGVWSQLILALWAGQEIIVDPYTLAKSGQVQITIQQLADYLVRQPLAFNVSTDSAAA
jgi:HK97 family phage major capsid protein/HK97 family phage prohead protease